MIAVTSSMSPGYLQVNPYFNENASKISKQYKNSDDRAGYEAGRKSDNAAVENVVASSHKVTIAEDKIELSKIAKEKAEREELELKEKLKQKEQLEQKLYQKLAEKEEIEQKEKLEQLKKNYLYEHDEKNKAISAENSLRVKEEEIKEKALVSQLEQNERQVIAHEAAHAAAGGRFAGSPRYSREIGPDGKTYITKGEVTISVPPSDNPEETIRNMQQVKTAALAPNNPSSQDINVAAAAANVQAQAEAELARHNAEWGEEPQPVRIKFNATDRVPSELPIVKKYHSSVDNDEPGSILSSLSRLREEANEAKVSNESGSRLTEDEVKFSGLAPENNLYNTRQAMKVYHMTTSPRGLWTVSNGFEKNVSSPELKQAQLFYIAA